MNQAKKLHLVVNRILYPSSASGADIDTPEAFDVLRSRRRQLIIEHLVQTDDAVTVGEVSEYLAKEEAIPQKTAHVALAHHHLPKLGDWGVVEYEKSSGKVSPTRLAYLLYLVQSHSAWLLNG